MGSLLFWLSIYFAYSIALLPYGGEYGYDSEIGFYFADLPQMAEYIPAPSGCDSASKERLPYLLERELLLSDFDCARGLATSILSNDSYNDSLHKRTKILLLESSAATGVCEGFDSLNGEIDAISRRRNGVLPAYALVLRGRASLCAGRFDSARKYFSRAAKIEDSGPVALMKALLGDVESYYLSQRYAECILAAQSAIKKLSVLENDNVPNSSDAIGSVLYYAAVSSVYTERHELFVKFASSLLVDYPHTSAARRMLEAIGTTGAVDLMLESVQGDEQELAGICDALYARGLEMLVYSIIKEFERRKGIDDFDLGYDLAGILGRVYIRLRMYDEAIALFSNLSEIEIDDAQMRDSWLKQLARAYSRKGDIDATVDIFQRLHLYHKDDDLATSSLFFYAWQLGRTGDFVSAARLMKQCTERPDIKRGLLLSAKWYLAWFSFRAGLYEQALPVFEELQASYYKRAAIYWMARSLQKLGRMQDAVLLYRDLIDSNFPSYYALLAWQRLGFDDDDAPSWLTSWAGADALKNNLVSEEQLLVDEAYSIDLSKIRKTLQPFAATCDVYSGLVRAVDLMDAGAVLAARLEVSGFFRTLRQFRKRRGKLYMPKECAYVSDVLSQIPIYELLFRAGAYGELYRLAVGAYFRLPKKLAIAARKWQTPPFFARTVLSYSNAYGIPAQFTLAIIQTESRFSTIARSRVGAMGLMQLMPKTLERIIAVRGMEPVHISRLTNPKVNIELGVWYLSALYERFRGSIALAAASYNAGPHNVAMWLSQSPNLPLDEFVESIPFRETRRYVKKVVRLVLAYGARYGGAAAFDDFTARVNPKEIGTSPDF